MAQRIGKYTIQMTGPVSLLSWASVASKKEGEGPLAALFDVLCEDTAFGEQTWEKAESRIQKQAVQKALQKASLSPADLDMIFAGDLLNQCISSTYGLRDLEIPLMGMYGACSTMAESLCAAALALESGAVQRCAAVTSSHFCSAERQFRFPLEYGGVRTPTAQWTVTGGGAVVLTCGSSAPYIRQITVGCIQDLGIKDANNMGAAMAPAAAFTIKNFLQDTGTSPKDYDRIFTGDLGQVGSTLLYELLEQDHISIRKQHRDCGLVIYDPKKQQDINAGGSGCGCSASVLCSLILGEMQNGNWKDVLFIATGALMSPTSVQQGESIPGIAHLVHLSMTPIQEKQQKGAE